MSISQPPPMAKSKGSEKAPRKAVEDGRVKKSKRDKTPKASKPKLSNLSEEKVVESDSDEQAPAPAKVKKIPIAQKAQKEKETVQTESSQVPKGQADTISSDGETSQAESSEDDEDQPQVAPRKPGKLPVKVNGVKRKPEESESEELESSSEDEESEKEQPPAKRARKAPSPDAKTSKVQKDSDKNDDSSESESSADAAAEEEASATQTIKSIPAAPFEPPKGYTPLETANPSSGSPFTSANLTGKQIWHIRAPSNVPIKHITEVALSSIQNAQPVLHHKGFDYLLTRDENRGAELDRVFLPGARGYAHLDQKVAEHFVIQQKIELPDVLKIRGTGGKGSQAAADVATPSVSMIRPQPKGLKMRYKPPGFGKGDPGRIGSDSESESEKAAMKTSSLQFPKTLGMYGVSDEPDQVPAAKKEKKKKKRQSEDVEMIDADENANNGTASMPPPSSTTPRKKDKKKKKEKSGTPERPGTASSQRSSESVASVEKVSKEKVETKEEKAARKEAKRLKQEARKSKVNGA